MTYAWTITKDYIAEPNAKQATNMNAVGVVGPRGATMTAEEIRNHPDRAFFSIYDDDGNRYYDGYMVHGVVVCPLTGEEEESTGLEPLDDFGEPNAGAIEIRYRNPAGKMVAL